MVGIFKGIWGLMTGEVINAADVTVNSGMTTVALALRRRREGDLFVSLKEGSVGNTQWVVFEPSEFDQFVAAVNLVRDGLEFERCKQPSR